MSFFRKHPEHPTRNTNVLNAHVSTWSFKQLYETLNNSNDEALLEACHSEYLRRGHAYYVWKQASQGNIERVNIMEENNAFSSENGRSIVSKPGTHDLTKWNSDQIKACIGTSDDTELLRACRIECNRRITEYERSLGKLELRAMEEIQKLFLKQNQQNNERMSRISRASSAFDASNLSPEKEKSNFFPGVSHLYPETKPDKALEHRCFKVSVVGLGQGAYGWWYGHFQGQKICREMEIVGHQPPLLLIEGKDDALMCKLNLNETGLQNKIGAGIRLEDFEKEWQKHRTAIQSAKSI